MREAADKTGKSMTEAPRILIAGTGSGCGKTTLTCGILYGLARQGYRPFAYKCGPDYIDSMFHSRVLEMETGNLDSFFTDARTLRALLAGEHAGNRGESHTRRGAGTDSGRRDIRVIEGVMGYYDGMGFSEKGSASEIAALTETPVILTVNARGMSRSVLAVLKGFLESQTWPGIQGVIFNQLSPMLYPAVCREAEALGVRVLGYVPRVPEAAFESRKLGLVTPGEIEGFREKLALLYDRLKDTLDWAGLWELAESAPPLPGFPVDRTRACLDFQTRSCPPFSGVKIGVAKDEAFCFLYQDNMDFLRRLGCEIAYFSPLRGEALPEGTDALILNGGYPELYADRLEQNLPMRRAVKKAVENGMPVIAECGGFMYLHQRLQDDRGQYHEMAGVLQGDCYRTPRLSRFGYITMKAEKDNLLCRAGEELKAHEFHYYDSTFPGNAFAVEKGGGRPGWMAGVADDTMYAGFPHLYFYGNPEAAYAFVEAAENYGKRRKIDAVPGNMREADAGA